jgi:hypothetical protein
MSVDGKGPADGQGLPFRGETADIASMKLVRSLACSLLLVGLVPVLAASCDGGSDPACATTYGFALGAACADDGDSHAACPAGASCTCAAGETRTDYICFNGKCVDSIGDCDAWCKAADADRQACF